MFRRPSAQRRILAMIDYLVDLADLRARSIVDLAEYDTVLWFADVPRSGTGVILNTDPDGSDIWIEARRPVEPLPPTPPDELRPWMATGERAPIVGQGPAGASPVAATLTELAAPTAMPAAIERSWRRWRDTAWVAYERERLEYLRGDEVFRRLSAIHQAELRLGEEYELVLGVGLLQWRSDDGRSVRRHLITANANLSLDAEAGVFTLGPAFDGAPLRVELDMLDVRDRPRDALRSAERSLLAADGDPFRRRPIDRVLASLARAMPRRGAYQPAATIPADEASDQPSIRFAPALILRRRSHRGVRLALRRIRDRIEAGGVIPPLLLDLCEAEPVAAETAEPAGVQPPPLFPLPVNREQLRVRELAARGSGTLVQGPPGTGKTHTIANLLCDLLARGERVLVTAQTPRALRALRRLLPDEIRPLCVHWLGSGGAERPAMEDGVRRILERQALYEPTQHGGELSRLRATLEQLRAEEDDLVTRIGRAREASREVHTVGSRHGTAVDIASQLAVDRSSLGFLEDEVDLDAPPPPTHLLEELLDTFDRLALSADGGAVVEPDILDEVPSPEEFDSLLRLEAESRNAEATRATAPFVASLEGVSAGRVSNLGAAFRDLHTAVSAAWRRAPHWAATAMRDVFRDRAAQWRELETQSHRLLDGLLDLARAADRQQLRLPEGTDLVALAHDSKELRGHLLQGGRIRRGLFRAAVVTRTAYVWRDVRLDGRPTDTPEALRALLKHLDVRGRVNQLWRQWSPHLIQTGASLAAQVTEIQENLEVLRQVLCLAEAQRVARGALAEVPGLPEPRWHDPTSLCDYSDSARAALAGPALREVAARLDGARRCVERKSPAAARPAAVDALLGAISDRDRQVYRAAYTDLSEVARSSSVRSRRRELTARLSAIAPRLTHDLLRDHNKERWRRRLPRLAAAWEHARAATWLLRWLERSDEHPLRRQLERVEERRRRATAELAAAMAWKHCFDRMTDDHRRHLVAWGQAMRGIGHGTGRAAARFRREAQAHLMACRDAVPAWIMPLYRVYDTIDPVEGAFDIAIVDDASQCGQDALPLLYLAKRVIVVGDDQQIRPTPVGIDPAHVEHLQQTYLSDLAHRDAFRPDGSLFDHAVRRFGERVVLREHFRCQPEIIRFSDDLCYQATPLLPVRRVAANRLPPLRTVYVEGAEREGKGAAAINVREAELVIDAVAEASTASRYRGRSFGVICLQGGAQARYIENALLRRLGPEECERRRLVCGNPYSFQGDERDVVFLSMVAAPNDVGPALTRSDFVRRFNVAASRARDQMILFHSVRAEELSEHDLRRRLLEFFTAKAPARDPAPLRDLIADSEGCDRAVSAPPAPFTTWLQVDVCRALADRGYAARPVERFARGRLDLVVEGDRQTLAIECDDERPQEADALASQLARQRLLVRAGWRVARVRASAFAFDPKVALEPVLAELRRLEIAPRTEDDGLAAYPAYEESLPDPLVASRDQLVAAVVDITGREGPVSRRRIQRLFATHADLDQLDARLGLAIDDALRESMVRGRLRRVENGGPDDPSDAAFGLAGVAVNGPRRRGPRRFCEIPKVEISAVLHELWRDPDLSIDQLFDRTLRTFDVDEPDSDDLDRLRAALLHVEREVVVVPPQLPARD